MLAIVRTLVKLAHQGLLGRASVLQDRQVIFERGEPACASYFLADGYVEIFQRTETGASMVVRLLCGPCLFGVLETTAAEPRYLESTRVIEHAIVHRIEMAALQRLLHTQPELAREVLATTAMAFCRVADTEMARMVDTEALLAAALCVYGDLFGVDTEFGRRIELRRSLADLAGVVGASERQVQRLLAVWKERGLVDKRDARHVVQNRAALANIAGGFESGWVHRAHDVPAWVYRVS